MNPITNYFDRIQELVNAMRVCKEKVTYQQVVDKILRTLPPEFDYVVATIKESKDLDTMEVEELQHSLDAHEMRGPTIKEKAKVPRKRINLAPIRNTKIKNLVKVVNPLKKGKQIKHKSKIAAPKIARSERESAKNKPNNRAHLAQDKKTYSNSEVVVLLAITSNKAQPRIPIEEEEKELIVTLVFNKASTVRRPLQLRDQELFQDSTVNLEGELIHSTLIAEVELVEFEKAMTEEK
ncbi:hypothetical protein CR513_19295, partial [Mucuna pruriens]